MKKKFNGVVEQAADAINQCIDTYVDITLAGYDQGLRDDDLKRYIEEHTQGIDFKKAPTLQ